MRKLMDELIRKQHELGIALGTVASLEEAARLCVKTAIHVSSTDCGGLYIINEKTQDLELVYQEGFLLDEFVQRREHRERPNGGRVP